MSTNGAVFFRDELYVGESFSGLDVGLEPVDALHARAWYRDVEPGLLEALPDVAISCFDHAAISQMRRAIRTRIAA